MRIEICAIMVGSTSVQRLYQLAPPRLGAVPVTPPLDESTGTSCSRRSRAPVSQCKLQ